MRQCRYCRNAGFVNLGPINHGGPSVFELCECQPPQEPLRITNPDDLMDMAQARLNRIDIDVCEVAA